MEAIYPARTKDFFLAKGKCRGKRQ
uniref:Uncharacterized protein n=1 Tax=Arundo donax TaxID=35708 RepID=A0A0A9FJS8_ARUDO